MISKTILCYGDSNTWGMDPVSGGRYDSDTRWVGILRQSLGKGFDVIEEGLASRTTVWEDRVEGVISGRDYLIPCLQSHRPLDLVILMLGTNDLKYRFSVSAFDIAEGVGALIQIIQKSGTGPDGSAPHILVLAPPPLGKLTDLAEMFSGGVEKSRQLGAHYKRVADLLDCNYFDTSQVISSSDADGVHFDLNEHYKLGKILADLVKAILLEQIDESIRNIVWRRASAT